MQSEILCILLIIIMNTFCASLALYKEIQSDYSPETSQRDQNKTPLAYAPWHSEAPGRFASEGEGDGPTEDDHKQVSQTFGCLTDIAIRKC